MSWFSDSKRSLLERFCINVLKCGPIPSHVAFIMDGNRRYANKCHFDDVVTGHVVGFDKLTQTLQWCSDLGIKEVTIYAFSAENFSRSQQEVDGLMNLARNKINKLLEEKEKIREKGLRIRFIGDLKLLPADLQKLCAEVMIFSQNNNDCVLNVCIAYTSRDEMTNTINDLRECVENGIISQNDMTEELFSDLMSISSPDLLIRTSNVERFSDFLLWQSSFTVLYFTDILWPEITIWRIFSAVFYYQIHCDSINRAKEIHSNNVKNFNEKQLKREFDLRDDCSYDEFMSQTKVRTERAVKYLRHKRDEQILQISQTP